MDRRAYNKLFEVPVLTIPAELQIKDAYRRYCGCVVTITDGPRIHGPGICLITRVNINSSGCVLAIPHEDRHDTPFIMNPNNKVMLIGGKPTPRV